jgi:hypothetical protein
MSYKKDSNYKKYKDDIVQARSIKTIYICP